MMFLQKKELSFIKEKNVSLKRFFHKWKLSLFK